MQGHGTQTQPHRRCQNNSLLNYFIVLKFIHIMETAQISPAQKLVRDIKAIKKKSTLEPLIPQIKALTATLDKVHELIEQGFHYQFDFMFENFASTQQTLLDVMVHITELSIKEDDIIILRYLAVDAGMIHTFNRFLASNLAPYLDPNNYAKVGKLSPMATNKLIQLDLWCRLQINFLYNLDVVDYVDANCQDVLDMILLFIDRCDTIMVGVKAHERIPMKILLGSIKSVMLDYCFLLSQFEWAQNKISTQSFDAIFITTLGEINQAVPCTMIYRLLSNMLGNKSFPVDKSPGFLRKIIIDFIEELVFPWAFVPEQERRQQLVNQVLQPGHTMLDDAIARCLYQLTVQPRLLDLFITELTYSEVNILPRYLYFLAQRGSQVSVFYMCLALNNIFFTERVPLDEEQSRTISFALILIPQTMPNQVIVASKLLKYLQLSDQDLVEQLFVVTVQTLYKQTYANAPETIDSDQDLVDRLRMKKNSVLLQTSQVKPAIKQPTQHQQSEELSVWESQLQQSQDLKSMYKSKSQTIRLDDDDDENELDESNPSAYVRKYWHMTTPKSVVLDQSLLSKESTIMLPVGNSQISISQDPDKFIYQIKKRYPDTTGLAFKNGKGQSFTFCYHSKSVCEFCRLLYVKLYAAPQAVLEKRMVNVRTLKAQPHTYEAFRTELLYALVQMHFEVSLIVNPASLDIQILARILCDTSFDLTDRTAIFLWMAQTASLDEGFAMTLFKCEIFKLQDTMFEVFWRSFGVEEDIKLSSNPQPTKIQKKPTARDQELQEQPSFLVLANKSRIEEINLPKVNVVLTPQTIGRINQPTWNPQSTKFESKLMSLGKDELIQYIHSQSDQLIKGDFTLYFFRLHTLYHSYQVIQNVLMRSLSTMAPPVLQNMLDALITTVVFFSDLSEKVVPVTPFLLETVCWGDCQSLMKEILDINTRTIEGLLRSGKLGAMKPELLVKLIRTLPNLPTVKSIRMLIQIIYDTCKARPLDERDKEVSNQMYPKMFVILVQALEQQNRNIGGDFQDLLQKNQKLTIKLKIYEEKGVLKILSYFAMVLKTLDYFFTSKMYKSEDSDTIFPEQNQIEYFLGSFVYFIELMLQMSQKFKKAGHLNEQKLSGQATALKMFTTMQSIKKYLILVLEPFTLMKNRQAEIFKSKVFCTIFQKIEHYQTDEQVMFLLFESLYNTCQSLQSYDIIKAAYPSFDKDVTQLFDHPAVTNTMLLPIIRALKVILLRRPKDSMFFQGITPILRIKVFNQDKYDKQDLDAFKKEMDKLSISNIDAEPQMMQQSIMNALEDPTFIFAQPQNQDQTIPAIPYSQLPKSLQGIYLSKIFEQEGKQLLKLLNLSHELELRLNEKQQIYTQNRRKFMPQAGGASYQMVQAVAEERKFQDSKVQQAKIEKGLIEEQQQQLQALKQKQLNPMQQFLRPSLDAPSKMLDPTMQARKVPDYYQKSTQQLFEEKYRMDATVEMEDILKINKDNYEMSRYMDTFKKQGPKSIQSEPAQVRRSSTLSEAAEKMLFQTNGNLNMSEMPFRTDDKSIFHLDESSIQFRTDLSKTTIKKDINMFQPFNLQKEINKAYQHLLNQ